MLSKSVRVLNFDNSLLRQKRLLELFHPEIIDFTHIGPSARFWMNNNSSRLIRAGLYPQFKGSPTFLGSGDFHNVSAVLLEQYRQPLTVISFDHHPDWDIFWTRAGCGSWVSRALENPNLKKIMLLGVASDDISAFSLQSGNLAALTGGRLEIYPYKHQPSVVFFRKVPDNPSIEVKRRLFNSRISWRELADKKTDDLFREIKARINTEEVYISIDKDCLKQAYSLTNWEEGSFSLDELLEFLRLFKDNFDIAGLDITGDYSEVNISGRIKAICSRLDHPRDYSAKGRSPEVINSVNETTNIKILECII